MKPKKRKTQYVSLFCLNHSADGFYIYHETDNVANLGTVRLLSPVLSPSTSHICVQFNYYMYGKDLKNVLRVLLKTPDREEEAWGRIGTQSPSWLNGSVTISKPTSQKFTVSVCRRCLRTSSVVT